MMIQSKLLLLILVVLAAYKGDLMPFEKVEYEFPDVDIAEIEGTMDVDIEIEPSSAEEVDIGGKKAKEKAEAKAEAKVEEPEAEDDYELEVVDDTPKADRGRKPSAPPEDVTDEELEDYSDKVRKRIKHFSKGYHDERRAKEQAVRERQELELMTQKLLEENKQLKGNVTKNQTALLEQAKKSTSVELEAAKKAYKEAYDAGDSEKILEAQESLTNAKIKADKLNNFKIPALQEEESGVQTEVYSEPVQAQPASVDHRAQEWQQENKWFNDDVEMTSYALGLHNKLVSEGVNPQSDEYYERIDTRMRELFPERFEDELEEKPQSKKKSNVVAPATRSTAPKKIRLNTTQLALAKRLGLTPKQYADQVAKDMRKENG
jgi:hypothetical protein